MLKISGWLASQIIENLLKKLAHILALCLDALGLILAAPNNYPLYPKIVAPR